MSDQIALSSKLPKDDEVNGLDSLHDSLVENPSQVIAALVWFDVPKITIDTETGVERPTVRVRRVEPFGTTDKIPDSVIKFAQDLEQKRTGRTPLPFDQLDSRLAHVSVEFDGDES